MLKVIFNRYLIILGFICSASFGNELSDLVDSLQKLEGKNEIQALVHIEDSTSSKKDKEIEKLEIDFMITADSNLISITHIGDIYKIANAPNATASALSGETSSARNFQEFSMYRAAQLTNYGPSLANELDGLTLKSKKSVKYEDIPCILWTLTSKQTQKTSGVKATTTRNVELWIDSIGFPVAAEFQTKISAKFLLVFSINSDTVLQQKYQHFGDRLLLTLDKNQTDLETEDGNVKRIVTTTVEIEN